MPMTRLADELLRQALGSANSSGAQSPDTQVIDVDER